MAFDMRGMSLALGAPEQRLFMWASEELNAFCRGREPGIPWGWGSMYTEAKTPGVQAAAEKMAGAMVYALLGARDLDGGGELKNIFSPEQLVIDCEIRDYVARLTAGVNGDCDPETCFAEIAAGIGHGFMGVDSTLDSYRDVYWFPRLFERRPVAAWIEAKGPDLRARAKSIAREFIAKYDYALADDISKEVNRIYADATKHLAVWPDDRRMA
jgi:trimethylamine:corrinoid methyltransferase-like protein